jgi:hypothetical protein
MAKPLQSASIAAPGFYGLNTQESSITLAAGFALQADNCVIDKYGRLGARKGWQLLTSGHTGVNLLGAHEFIDINGDRYFGAWSDTGFYIVDGSTLTPVTYSGSSTIEDGNWQAVTLNDAAYLFQRGYEPIYFNPTTGVLDDVTSATNTATVTMVNTWDVTLLNTHVISATHSGTVAEITHLNHRLATGDEVIISGANETEYNGTFTITVLDDNTYEYTMSSSPSQDATGTVLANSKIAVVEHDSHGFATGDEVKISGANETGYNGTFTIHVTSNDEYYYEMSSIPTQDATGTTVASIEKITVSHTYHRLLDGTEVTFSGATPSDYNGTFTITVIDSNSYYFTIPSIPTSNASGTITATWDKGTPPSANTVISAYGRLWAADTEENKTTVYWSNLLDGTSWEDGTAGSIDLSSVLVKGNDEIVALGAHAGRLIIFCKDNVVIYGDTDGDTSLNPATMKLVEVISGVGCISRDSVQNTGTDILFLAKDGLRSLGRLIQEKSQPMRDLSKNIRDELVRAVLDSDPTAVKSVYSASEAFYLLLIPEYKRIYCFDTRSMLQDGSARVTVWDNQVQTNMIEANNTLYFTGIDGMSRYYGYSDNGNSYTIKYYTNYFDFGDATKQKFLKRLSTTLIGGSGQDMVVKVGYDYEDSYTSFPVSIATQNNAEYGVAEYNTTAEYTIGTLSDTVRAPVGGSGGVIQVGFEATIEGSQLSIQKLDIYTKEGRVY